MITTERRAEIVTEFAERHGGIFDPREFLSEVESTGMSHPAWDWFEWNHRTAAHKYRLHQAIKFTANLTIKVEVRTVQGGALKITREEAPLALSPLRLRHAEDGGGYIIAGPRSPDYLDELTRQAAARLTSYVARYSAALIRAGLDPGEFERIAAQLEKSTERQQAA